MQQNPVFSVDLSVNPWMGTLNRVISAYAQNDNERIASAIYMILTPGIKPRLLVPLTRLVPDGPSPYAVLIRNDRVITVLQLEVGFNANNVDQITRPLIVPDTMKARFPHISFRTSAIDTTDCNRLFWNVLSRSWESEFDTLSLSNPQVALMGRNGVGFLLGQEHWVAGNVYPNPQTHMVVRSVRNRIGFYLQIICHPTASQTQVMVNDNSNHAHFVALIRNGATVNMVDVRFVPYPNPCIIERVMFVPPEFTQDFPGIQFTSVRLSIAEKNALMMEPVRRHYWTLTDAFFVKHRDRVLRFTALAMGLHGRIGGGSMIARLDRETVIAIALLLWD